MLGAVSSLEYQCSLILLVQKLCNRLIYACIAGLRGAASVGEAACWLIESDWSSDKQDIRTGDLGIQTQQAIDAGTVALGYFMQGIPGPYNINSLPVGH